MLGVFCQALVDERSVELLVAIREQRHQIVNPRPEQRILKVDPRKLDVAGLRGDHHQVAALIIAMHEAARPIGDPGRQPIGDLLERDAIGAGQWNAAGDDAPLQEVIELAPQINRGRMRGSSRCTRRGAERAAFGRAPDRAPRPGKPLASPGAFAADSWRWCRLPGLRRRGSPSAAPSSNILGTRMPRSARRSRISRKGHRDVLGVFMNFVRGGSRHVHGHRGPCRFAQLDAEESASRSAPLHRLGTQVTCVGVGAANEFGHE